MDANRTASRNPAVHSDGGFAAAAGAPSATEAQVFRFPLACVGLGRYPCDSPSSGAAGKTLGDAGETLAMRIAAIDIGTNSVHMVIADSTDTLGFEVVDREREVVQIGRGSFHSSRLRPEAIQRTVSALHRFVQLARRHQVDRILCTATAAVRESSNGGDFLVAARQAAGIVPRVIPASVEGRLIYLAVKAALPLDETPSLIVDIGGGSMQLVVGTRDKLIDVVSVPLGALRLGELWEASDPPTRGELQRLSRLIRKIGGVDLKRILAHEPKHVYGSSGSIHALAHVAYGMQTGQSLEMINGHLLTIEALEQTTRRLQRMTLKEREALQGIDSKRAEIIVPGAKALLYVLEKANADGIVISDYGVREGLVTDYIQNHAQEITSVASVQDLRLRSVMHVLTKFQGTVSHAQHVAKLALELFDGLRAEHRLGAHARELLHYAALLHDVGAAIGYDGHGEHSYYVIKHANLRGMTAEELERIAIVARYHGKQRPKKRDEAVRVLPKADRRMVQWLSAILCVAEGLDRSHYELVRSVAVQRRGRGVRLKVMTRRDAQLEVWAARGRVDRLERLMGRPVRLVAESERPSRAKPEAPRRGRKRVGARTPATAAGVTAHHPVAAGEAAGAAPDRAKRAIALVKRNGDR
jgi:exopolyphosphatase / guanosine-5'-triphosphate,3'-diphosphate pyrophosphatase